MAATCGEWRWPSVILLRRARVCYGTWLVLTWSVMCRVPTKWATNDRSLV